MMNTSHIVKSFDDELNAIESLVLEMGGLVERQLEFATVAVLSADTDKAKSVIKSDSDINVLEADVNQQALRVLAVRQPVATDLRAMVMTLKIASHLERMGDYCKNMARRANTIADDNATTGSLKTLQRMSEQVQSMIRSALDSYTQRDPDMADAVRMEDAAVDQMHNTLFRELLTYMMEDPRNISSCMHLLFIAKNMERVGDHAVEIAQEVMFLVTGEWPEDKRPKGDRTSRMIFTPEELGDDANE